MKFIYIFLLTSLSCLSQEISFSAKMNPGDYSTYFSKENIIIKENQQILLGFPSNGNKYTYIVQGDQPIDARLNSIYVTIDKIKIVKLQNNASKAYAIFKGFGLVPVYIDIEAALYFKEIIIQ